MTSKLGRLVTIIIVTLNDHLITCDGSDIQQLATSLINCHIINEHHMIPTHYDIGGIHTISLHYPPLENNLLSKFYQEQLCTSDTKSNNANT